MQHRRRTAALLFTAILASAACSSEAAILTQPSAPAGAPLAAKATVQKFTFANVTFSDGVVGDIQAGSKHNNKSDFTVWTTWGSSRATTSALLTRRRSCPSAWTTMSIGSSAVRP